VIAPAGGLPTPEAVAVIATVLVVGAGVIAGLTGRIVVYRDYGHIVWCFALLVVPFGLWVLGAMALENAHPFFVRLWMWVVGFVAVSLLFVIAQRTWQDNADPWSTCVALLTKIPLGLLYVGMLAQFVAPQGRTADKRAGERQFAFLLLFLLTPLLLALTRDKDGFGTRFPRMR